MRRSPHAADEQLLRRLLAESRQSRGITQQALAERLKAPQSFVSKYETGERRLTVLEFVAICEAMGDSAPAVLKRFIAHRGQPSPHVRTRDA